MKDFQTAKDLVEVMDQMFYRPAFMIPERLISEKEMDTVQDKINAVEGYLDEAKS